jgi:hypothetical protein
MAADAAQWRRRKGAEPSGSVRGEEAGLHLQQLPLRPLVARVLGQRVDRSTPFGAMKPAMLASHSAPAPRFGKQCTITPTAQAGCVICRATSSDRQIQGDAFRSAGICPRPVADLQPTELLARKLSIAAESGQIDSVLKAVRWDVACENGRGSVSGRSRCQPMQHPASCLGLRQRS